MRSKILCVALLASLFAPIASFAQDHTRDRNILELWWGPASSWSPGWHWGDLSSVTKAPAADSRGNPETGYAYGADGTQHVAYRGTDNHIHQLWWSVAEGWHVDDPSGATGAPDAEGDPAGYVLDADGTQHVVYRGFDNHIYELWWGPPSNWSPGWHWGDLITATGAPLAAGPRSDPAGYALDADGTQHVVYRGFDNHIYELWWGPTAGWHWGNLTGSIGAPLAASDTGDPAGYVLDADGTQHVVYRGNDGHIYELWWGPASSWSPGWHWGDLTDATGAPAAYGNPAGYVLDADGTQHVVYKGKVHSDPQWWSIDELWWAPRSGWHYSDLTGATGAPAAWGDPAAYVRDADGTQHVVYSGPNNHIFELWWGPASNWFPSWHWGDLTGTTGAPAAAGNPAGYVLDTDGTQHVVVGILPPRQPRKSVNALTGNEVMSLRRGVAQMMAWNTAPRNSADFRRSWVYWANMHSHFGSDCVTSSISGPGLEGVRRFSASNASETATWCQCEHSTDLFLTWHRMFLWYFERVLQAAAGDPFLRLPFWDYATDATLPAAYRDPTYVNGAGQTVPNPLRVNARQPSLNDGSSGLAAAVRSAAGAMQATSFPPFSRTLEGIPHGSVHVAVGVSGNGLMGLIPSSALDPIFWAHHTNIDRLYDCWLGVDEQARLPSDPAHLNRQFTFVDADGSTPTRRVGDMLRASELGYTYAQGGDCPAVIMATAAGGLRMIGTGVTASASEQAFALAGPKRLERGVTIVPIDVPPTVRDILSARAQSAGHIYVVIDGLAYDQRPGALYNVYLKGDGDRREQIGVINFFSFTAPRGGTHADHDSSAGRFVFDATDAMRLLAIGTAAKPLLVFEPTTGLTDSSPSAAAERISLRANVRFDSVRILIASQ